MGPRARVRGVRRGDPAWIAALRAGKPAATAWALLLFVAGVTLDDLHVFRLPMIYVGAGAAILCYAGAPVLFASRLASRLDEAPAETRAARLEAALLRRRAALALSAVAFVVWLILFSSGRTPRW
ncbi:MAG: hypothetical protein QOE90_2580 [Thermoplasmata archaeon]|jgi:hypothetical protein|nr:hypothetical protein [Thermoplasmata archaeon]